LQYIRRDIVLQGVKVLILLVAWTSRLAFVQLCMTYTVRCVHIICRYVYGVCRVLCFRYNYLWTWPC